MSNYVVSRKNSGVIQIRYKKESTKIGFMEVSVNFTSHEEALSALVKFWKDNNTPGEPSKLYHLK